VVIPLWNGRGHIGACLDALRAQTLDHEVLVVDNASPDGAGEHVAKGYPEVALLRSPRNVGFAGGTNLGLRAARGALLVTLNQDAVAEPRFLEEIARGVDLERRVGMVASKMLFLHDPRLLNSTGIALTRDFYARDRGHGERDEGQWEAPGEVFGPCGGAGLYARALLDDVGLFDERFFCYFEDVDLAWRARLAGWQCAYAPRAVVRHAHRSAQGTREGLPPQVRWWCERNRVWAVAKNAGAGTLLRRSAPLLAGEALAVVHAARARDGSALRARWHALRGLAPVLADRARVQRARRVPEAALRGWWERDATPKAQGLPRR
jgi:hypothetical protein